jgi:hypothetical protein
MTVESSLSPPGQFLASPLKLYYAIKKLPGRRYIHGEGAPQLI